MTRLAADDRKLLDFLCACAAAKVRVVNIKVQVRPSLRRLRYAGLVGLEDYQPSPSVLAAWQERQTSTVRPSTSDVEERHANAACGGDGGAADARCADEAAAAVPPETFRCGHARTPDNSRKAKHAKGGVRCRTCSNEATRECMRKARARAKKQGSPRPAYDPEKVRRANARRADGVRKAATRRAQERIDKGLPPSHKAGAQVMVMQQTLERQQADERRLADPIEQAKSKLQRRFRPVVSMAVYDGDPSLFKVGHRNNVTQDELLRMAEALAA